MRLGLLGGTFDPVHWGHLLMAEQCREQCRLDQVWLLPAGLPPHKSDQTISTGNQRAEMLEFAVAGNSNLIVNRMELSREGKTYTVDTLAQLHQERPEDELFFIIGADSLVDLPDWREPDRICEYATVVAVNRGDRPLPSREELTKHVGETIASRVELVTMPGIDLSATDIRHRVREGRSIRFMVPRAVEAYIAENQLYLERN
ncbi:MAG: nicotinate-nucleotide adenylyltransferase [Planctomycetaceae bacterium]|nr:nicotinate-nucleotide adenylyltransferase [Planctomycetaceae bacterium]